MNFARVLILHFVPLICIGLIVYRMLVLKNSCGQYFVESNVQHVAVSISMCIYYGFVHFKLH